MGVMILGGQGFGQTLKKETTTRKPTIEKQTPAVKTNATNLQSGAAVETASVLGRYDLYAGIPSMYLGHLVLMSGGKYKIAFSTDETDYETGSYIYHADTNTLEWLSGLAKRKEWNGKLIKKAGGYRIEFNKTTFAEN